MRGRPRRRLGAGLDPASLHERRLSSSRAPVARETAWKGSAASSAPGALSATTSAIRRAPSAVTSLPARRPSVSRSRKALSWRLPCPAQARTTLPRSWSTTTVKYLRPLLQPVSSTPIERGPSRRPPPVGLLERGPHAGAYPAPGTRLRLDAALGALHAARGAPLPLDAGFHRPLNPHKSPKNP